MLHRTFSAALFAATIAASLPAAAHFGLILPEPAMVLEQSKTAFKLDVSFIRPMEASTMTMVKPAAFYVVEDGRKTDLTPALHPGKLFGRDDWTLEYKFENPASINLSLNRSPIGSSPKISFTCTTPRSSFLRWVLASALIPRTMTGPNPSA